MHARQILVAMVGPLVFAGCGTGPSHVAVTGYSASPRVAKAVLAQLRAPSGFTRSAVCFFPSPGGGVCFRRHPSLPIHNKQWAALVKQVGVNALPGKSTCSRNRRFAHPRLQLATCHSLATLRGVRVMVDAVSLVKAGPAGGIGTAAFVPQVKDGPKVLGGTEIDAGVIGTPSP
jgi:hypothetical protein